MYSYSLEQKAADALEIRMLRLLSELDVAKNLKGHSYLMSAIRIAVKDPDTIYAVTKKIYAHVSEMNNTTVGCVESAIRNAIASCWRNGDAAVQRGIFGNTVRFSSGRPSDSEFIAVLAHKLRAEGFK